MSPKYLNSPENPIFQKRSTLFCLERARRPADQAGELLVVEGYFDCLSLHRVGITNSVATLGTALTPDHARLLRRRLGDGDRVVLCYDADEAGRRAAMTGIRVLLEAGVDVAVLVLPDGTDPDDVVRDGGAEAIRELLKRPASALEFLLAGLPEQPEALRREGLKLAPLVCAASNAATRQNLVEELARRLYLRPREIEEHGRSPVRRAAPIAPAGGPRHGEIGAPGERHLARILLEGTPHWRARIVERVRPELIDDDRVRSLARSRDRPRPPTAAGRRRPRAARQGARTSGSRALSRSCATPTGRSSPTTRTAPSFGRCSSGRAASSRGASHPGSGPPRSAATTGSLSCCWPKRPV